MNKNMLLNLTIGVMLGVLGYAMFIEPMIPIQRVRD